VYLSVLSEAAVSLPVQKMDPGWTWTATIQLVSLIFGTGIGGGLLWTTAKGVSLLWQKSIDARKMDNDAAAAVRREMMEFNAQLQKRIEDLEKAGREERKRWDDEMAGLRKLHAEEVIQVRNGYEGEIRALREEISGLRRQMAQWSQTSEAAISLSKTAPTSAIKRAGDAGIGDLLRKAYEVPGVGEDGD